MPEAREERGANFAPLRRDASARPIPPLMRVVSWPVITLMRSIQKIEVSGHAHVPDTGPVIVVSNHTGHLDGPAVGVVMYEMGMPPSFLAKEELFSVPVLGWAIRNLGQIPAARGSKKAKDSLDHASKAIERNACIAIFPEGTFTHDPDGWPMKGKTGVARLVAKHPDVPVLPLAQWGNGDLIHPFTGKVAWRKILRRTETLWAHCGAPVDLSHYRKQPVTAELLAEMTETIMSALTEQVRILREREAEEKGTAVPPVPERRFDVVADADRDPFAQIDAENRARHKRKHARRRNLGQAVGTVIGRIRSIGR